MKYNWASISILALTVLVLCHGSLCSEFQQTAPTSDPGNYALTAPEPQSMPVAGSWGLFLIDSTSGTTKLLNLEISQTGNLIFGRGSLSKNGQTKMPVQTGPRPTEDEGIESMVWWLHQEPDPLPSTKTTRSLTIGASGLVEGNMLSLDLIFLEENVLYKLNLNVVESSISGNYQAYDSLGRVRMGSCYGSIHASYGGSYLSLGSERDVINLGGMRSR